MSITLHLGDCLEVMKLLPDKSVDCFICDLPYGCLISKTSDTKLVDFRNKSGDVKKKISACAWDIKLNLELFWEQIHRLRKNEHTPCLMFCTTKFGIDLINSNPKEFRYDLVWDKQRGVSFLTANKMPMRSHEMIYVFSKAGAYYNRVDLIGEFAPKAQHNGASKQYGTVHSVYGDRKRVCGNTNTRCVLSVINNSTSSTRNGHPTEKPMELYRFLMERYCPPGGTMLDPTAGSFNSCFVAYDMDRHGIGIEKDEGFHKKASDRADKL